jgi:hypothetical protein
MAPSDPERACPIATASAIVNSVDVRGIRIDAHRTASGPSIVPPSANARAWNPRARHQLYASAAPRRLQVELNLLEVSHAVLRASIASSAANRRVPPTSERVNVEVTAPGL